MLETGTNGARDDGAAAGREELRERGGVAEHIRDPDVAAAPAEVLLEEPLTVDELAHDRLAAQAHGHGARREGHRQ